MEPVHLMKTRSRIGSVCFIKKEFIVAGLVDGSIAIYDSSNYELLHTNKKHIGSVDSLVFNGQYLISAGEDGDIRVWLWNGTRLRCENELNGHRQNIRALQATKTRLYSGGTDKSIRVWNLSDFVCLTTLSDAHEKNIQTLNLSENEKFLFSSGNDGIIKVWDTEAFECIANLDDRAGWIRSLNNIGRYLVSGGNDRQIVVKFFFFSKC